MWHVTFLKYFILDPLSLTFILGGFIHSVLFLWNKWVLSSTFHYSLISFSCSRLNDPKPFKLYLIWDLCLSEATSFVRLACSKGTAINVQTRRGDEAENLSIGYFRLTNWDSSSMKNHQICECKLWSVFKHMAELRTSLLCITIHSHIFLAMPRASGSRDNTTPASVSHSHLGQKRSNYQYTLVTSLSQST